MLKSPKSIFTSRRKVELSSKHGVARNSITIEKTEFLTSDFKTKRPDVLFRVKTKEKEIFTFILIEYQSYKDHNMAFRMADYMMKIWDMYMKRHHPRSKRKFFKYPQIIPIVLYTGSGRWTPVRDLGDKNNLRGRLCAVLSIV